MQINSVAAPSFQGVGFKTKEFNGALKDGSNAIIKFSHDSLDEIKSFDCYITRGEGKNKYIIGGIGAKNSYGLDSTHVDELLAKLQLSAKEGVNFFQEFTRALLTK